MTTTQINTQTPKQAYRLLQLLLEHEVGKVFNPIQARQFVKDAYGIEADWHVFSDVLESMKDYGRAAYVTNLRRIDGQHNYLILEK